MHAVPATITPHFVTAGFAAHFAGDAKLYCAPARVNIIGEHTDYNGGLVLPTTTGLFTWVAAAPRNDRIVGVYSEHFAEYLEFDLEKLNEVGESRWIDYVRGVAAMLEESGVGLRGTNLYLAGDIPVGGGLSSSASLELASGLALLDMAGRTLPGDELARLCQRAETEIIGLACGIMDQLAVACCARGSAMLLDCRDNQWATIKLPQDLRLMVVDCGVKHQLPSGGYNDRASECRQAVECLRDFVPGLETLRGLKLADLDSHRAAIGETLHKRCRHVVTENARTAAASEALSAGDLGTLGTLISQSHASLRDDYEVSCAELDTLAAIADNCDGVLGARMVGAGFGGCVVALVSAESADNCLRHVVQSYERITGQTAWSHIVSPASPAHIIAADSGPGEWI